MVFDAAAVAAQQQQHRRPFHFLGMDGEEYELPDMKSLTPRQVQAFEQSESLDDFQHFLEEVAPDAVGATADMPLGVLEELMGLWGRTGGAAGKSPAPSSRKPKRGKPPKRT